MEQAARRVYNKVTDENEDLKARALRLKRFIRSDKIQAMSPASAALLKAQLNAMNIYSTILDLRLTLLESEVKRTEGVDTI